MNLQTEDISFPYNHINSKTHDMEDIFIHKIKYKVSYFFNYCLITSQIRVQK